MTLTRIQIIRTCTCSNSRSSNAWPVVRPDTPPATGRVARGRLIAETQNNAKILVLLAAALFTREGSPALHFHLGDMEVTEQR